jgi:hypothetical protein
MTWRLALPVAALVLSGCGGERASQPPTDPLLPLATASAEPTDPTALADVMEHPEAQLVDARVSPLGDGFRVAAWWRCADPRCPRPHDVLAVSDDGFESVQFIHNPSSQRLDEVMPPALESTQGQVPALEDLIQWRLPSLVRGERQLAVLGGSDGATLFPFEKAARSTDGGESWTVFDVAQPGDVMSYAAGGVVLSDSRLLTLVSHWSDDRADRPTDRPRGLIVSAGDDWSRFTPIETRFTPALTSPKPAWSAIESIGAMPGEHPVIWVTTYDNRLYISVDDARTFRGTPAR